MIDLQYFLTRRRSSINTFLQEKNLKTFEEFEKFLKESKEFSCNESLKDEVKRLLSPPLEVIQLPEVQMELEKNALDENKEVGVKLPSRKKKNSTND